MDKNLTSKLLIPADIQIRAAGSEINFKDELATTDDGTSYYIKRDGFPLSTSKNLIVKEGETLEDAEIVDPKEYDIDLAFGLVIFKNFKKRKNIYISGKYYANTIFALSKGFTYTMEMDEQKEYILGSSTAISIIKGKKKKITVTSFLVLNKDLINLLQKNDPFILNVEMDTFKADVLCQLSSYRIENNQGEQEIEMEFIIQDTK